MTATAATTRKHWYERRPVHIGLAVTVTAIALVALHNLSREVTLASLRAGIAATSGVDILLATLFTCLSFAALACYDIVAVRIAAPGRVPVWLAAFTGASGAAISNMLGFSLLTGAAFRARVYGSRGLDLSAVGGVLATSWLTFWLGVSAAAGLALLLDPNGPAALVGLPPAFDRAVGGTFLATILAFFIWVGTGARVLRFRSVHLRLPPLRLALLQTGLALVDIAASAAALYVLLPQGIAIGPAAFFIVYVVAILVGLISHSPGGLGAFEAVVIATLGLGGQPDVIAALILYRLIYYILPFVLAATVLATIWIRMNRRAAGTHALAIRRALEPLVPPLAGGIALLCGAVLLFSGALPALPPRTAALEALAPLALVESSHLVGSALGAVLVVLARGLILRQARAWAMAMTVLALGIAASLLKGLDWEEAGLLTLAMALLAIFRSAFYRQSEGPLRLTWGWGLGALMLIGASVWLGFLSYRHVDYSNALWWRFAWEGDAPRFLRGSVAAAVALAGIGAATLLSRRRPDAPPEPIPDTVRRLVAASPETEANIALLGDKRFLVAPDETAFIMYRQTSIALIAKSDPFGDPDAGAALAWVLRERADQAGLIPAFYAVGTRHLPTYLDMGLSILKIGEVARVELPAFTLDEPRRKELRYARARARRDGLSFAILPPDQVAAALDELRRVSDAWMAEKQGQEKSFALGRFDPGYLASFPHAVMRDGQGRITAFANLWLGAERDELSLDLMRYDPAAASVAMSALFAELMLWGRAEGYRWFNLGAVPFAGMGGHRLTTRWNQIGALIYEHGETLYHFEGLRSFKEKFDPVWTPNYLACPGGLAAARVLIEVNRLISGGARGLFG